MMDKIDNADLPAMPIVENGETGFYESIGLTKREHFAGLAMQGMLSDPSTGGDSEMLAVDAVNMADALLKELEK